MVDFVLSCRWIAVAVRKREGPVMKRTSILTGLLVFATLTRADAVQQITVYGEGTMSCGAWATAQLQHPPEFGHRAWVLGYVTARADAGLSLRRTDTDGIEAAVDSYCRANPTRAIVEAARDVVEQLSKR